MHVCEVSILVFLYILGHHIDVVGVLGSQQPIISRGTFQADERCPTWSVLRSTGVSMSHCSFVYCLVGMRL